MILETHDLATLPDLNETIILEYLKARYKHDNIYTYIGDILLAINPFKALPIYDKQHHNLYRKSNRSTTPPHVFALADYAYENLKNNSHKSQCCVISGESGAGKTENAKHFIKHLIYLCVGNTRLELQILQVNPLLEAFGNAVTSMNDNSSRFGKYIELSFFNNKVVGAQISEYLLEKSRVVFQNEDEQNFHIFYYLIAGLEDSQSGKYYLANKLTKRPTKFNYLKDHKLDSKLREKLRLREKFDDLINAMNYVAFLESEQTDLFSALIGILHVGNLSFQANDDGYAKFVETPDAKFTLTAIQRLLGINTTALISAMTTSVPTIAGGRDEFVRFYTLEAALDARDALAKHVYLKVFSWLVAKINRTLMCAKNYGKFVKQIGILDIYGFEHFQKNSFEQLCINLANEQIQYFFNKHIFSLEKDEYTREGINTISITFNDNQPLLDLFMGNSGILKKLDDLCRLPKTTDATLIENFNKEFSRSPEYTASKRNDTSFTINHYAGKVKYSAENFLEKNRDSLPLKMIEIFKESKNKILSEIFISSAAETNQNEPSPSKALYYRMKDAKTSVSAQYRNSLEVLMKRMSASKPIFMRCIKPNPSKKSDDFDTKFVLLQLRYCGILETTRIRKEGYSLRPTFEEFVERYKYLSPSNAIKYDAETATRILANTGLTNWRVGKSKVFLKYYHYDELKSVLDQYIAYAVIIQKYIRGWLAIRQVSERVKKSKLEQNRLAEFCGRLSLQADSFYETVAKTSVSETTQKSSSHVKRDRPESSNYYETNYSDQKNHTYLSIDQVNNKPPGRTSNQLIYDNMSNSKENSVTPRNKYYMGSQQNGEVKKREPCWLFGKITRGQSEKFLRHKELGTYLVRKSDSRDGYSLSFKAENRCRHYMVDALPNGKFIIIGEPRVHKNLKDLTDYHRNHKLSNWNGYLTSPFNAEN